MIPDLPCDCEPTNTLADRVRRVLSRTTGSDASGAIEAEFGIGVPLCQVPTSDAGWIAYVESRVEA